MGLCYYDFSYNSNFLVFMSYQVLARKWRPQLFADVVGQEDVLTTLTNGLLLGRIHHAYLFSGTRGVGKTTIARLLVKGLNCKIGITATPCSKCDNCREIEQGRFIDLIEIDAASRTKVEDTRDLLENIQYAPARGNFKVYLIDEVHMLSRHSFNALLKTLEEPPLHVKFLLATTDPQKLPVTILSRCLQLHLKALNVEHIEKQLKKILKEEKIISDDSALQLLARAADGSMRDALSLTDQAIAMGNEQVTVATVRQMLNTLDNEHSIAILEALIHADTNKVMAQVSQAAERGVEWENLLVETLAILHRIAMIQLMPTLVIENQYIAIEQRLRELAQNLPPADIQLYYQILLVGRKELIYAPNRRMGVEMTLLRALAFYPKGLISESKSAFVFGAQLTQEAPQFLDSPQILSKIAESKNQRETVLSDAVTQVLKARSQLQQKKICITKKSEPTKLKKTPIETLMLERLASVTRRSEQCGEQKNALEKQSKPQTYPWRASKEAEIESIVNKPKALRMTIENEKSEKLLNKLLVESIKFDVWASVIHKIKLPNSAHQLALNSFMRQEEENNIVLHLRSAQSHLNSASSQKILVAELSKFYGYQIKLTILIDDNPEKRTPLEWRKAIYEEQLARARQSIFLDTNIRALCRVFDAEIDEDSIRPI